MILEGFDIKQAEAQIEVHKNSLDNKRIKCTEYQRNSEIEIKNYLINTLKIDINTRSLKVRCYENDISFTYFFNAKETDSYFQMEIKFVKDYEIGSYTRKNQATLNNLKEGDISGISFPNMCIDLMKYPLTSIDEVLEYASFSKYLIEELKTSGELINLIYKFYEELRKQWKDIGNESTEYYQTQSMVKAYYVGEYIKEFEKDKILDSKNNIIVIKEKEKDFYTLRVYEPVIITKNYYTYNYHSVTLIWDYSKLKNATKEKYLYHLNLKKGSENQKIKPKEFLQSLANNKHLGNDVVVFTREDWEIYQEMLSRETVNILYNETNDEFYNKRSEIYEELYRRKRD